jgi:tetratricopeptide (TPR) repeat protein
VSASQALASYEEAEAIAQQIQTEAEGVHELAESLWGIGEAYRKLGDERRACTAYTRSFELSRGFSNSPRFATAAAAAEKAHSTCAQAHH